MDETIISWTESTWNPWRGCTKVSQGCKNCYMFLAQQRYGTGDPSIVIRAAPSTFDKPLHWSRGRKVFTCSWSDWFHASADPWRDDAWDIIRRTPQHTYQILTKRPERILSHLPTDWGQGWPHVWLGTSVEDQRVADRRIPELLRVPAAVRFLSCEPLLSSLGLRPYLGGLSWVIGGGESGPGHRACDERWAIELRDQCVEAGVAYYWKQWAAYRQATSPPPIEGVVWAQYPRSSTAEAPITSTAVQQTLM